MRRNENIITRISELRKSVDEIKSTQFSGYDNSKILVGSSPNQYDEIKVLSPFPGVEAFERHVRYTADLKPWQPSQYTRLVAQFWVDNMSNPWDGTTSGISVLNPAGEDNKGGIPHLWQQVVLLDGTTHTLYIKYYVITTTITGTISVTGGDL